MNGIDSLMGMIATEASEQVEETPDTIHYQDADLQLWFGLSYASFLVLPRVLMEAMPEEWQSKIAALLIEYDEAFPNQPDISTRVQITQNGKLIKTPAWLINYRRPDKEAIDKLRSEEVKQ